MSDDLNQLIKDKAFQVFEIIVNPVFSELIEEYDNVKGYEVVIVNESPLIMGIELYNSIMFKHPDGMEMIICVYWLGGHDKLVAENIRMVTLNKVFNIYEVTKKELKKQIKFLAALGS
ncbi:MAG: hypothetical protein ACE5H1_02360 [Thermodesulfobacteriota bacterium]